MTVRPAIPSGLTRAGDAGATFAIDVQYYLSQEPRQLPSRYLYDALGSCLFEAICRLPWYSITRAETQLLAAHRHEIFGAAEPLVRIAELGCGSGEKLAALVSERPPSTGTLELHLIDVSATALAVSTRALNGFDGIRVFTHEAPYEVGLMELRDAGKVQGRTLVLFLGSNIGNFDRPGADEFLMEIRAALHPGDFVLLGTDLVKPEPVLQLAYDDPLGVTAAFNLNLLLRINRELGGNFDLDSFAHSARWNARESRVEMHLVSMRRQAVRVRSVDLEFELGENESIWTESSYKYEPAELIHLVERAGFEPVSQWIEANEGFALTMARTV